ncbi:ras-domain-containing protein, partial [Aureobasidium melanogenum]
MAQTWDYIAKIVSLGDSGCGKSSLTIRLCEGRFSPHHDVTIGVEFGSRIVPVGPPASLALNVNNPSVHATPAETPSNTDAQTQKHMKLSLWDTAGQETYKSITRSYFRGASGALLVFDITRRATFDSVTAWLNDLRQIAEENIIVVLVGNKSDLAPATSLSDPSSSENKRQVTQEEAEAWCKENKVMQYVETSAKSGENVERAFREVAERIYQNIEAGKYDLNDRRSGVKGPGASSGANTARTINLAMNDAASVQKRAKQGACC